MNTNYPTEPGYYLDAEDDLWRIAPGSTTLRLLTDDGMRATDDDAEELNPSHFWPFRRVELKA